MATGTMNMRVWGLTGVLVITAWLLGSVTWAGAQTMKWKVNNYITQLEYLPITDIEGHVVGVGMRRGLAFFENGEVATYSAQYTFDLINRKGTFKGYASYAFEDGSSFWAAFQDTEEPGPRGLLSGRGTGEFIKGTGRFQGIKGSISFTGRELTLYSKENGTLCDTYLDATATYTLPSK